MRKINWEDYPSTDTPINADNLNAMQNNIEEAIEENIITNTETPINKYIDNKQVYVKKIDIGSLPNSGRKIVTPGLSNVNEIIKMEGTITKESGNDTADILKSTSLILYRKSSDQLFIDTSDNKSNYTGYLFIYYTKT